MHATVLDFLVVVLLIALMADLFHAISRTCNEQRGYLYYTSFFAAIELVILALALISFIVYYLRLLKLTRQLGMTEKFFGRYVSFDEITFYDDTFRYFFILMLIACVIRCYRFLRMNNKIQEFEFIIFYCFPPLFNLVSLFIVFSLGFGTVLNLLLGTHHLYYSNFWIAICQPLVLALGPLQYLPHETIRLNKHGNLLYMVIILMVIVARIVFWNLFLCVLIVGWYDARKRFLKIKSRRKVLTMFMYLRERWFEDSDYERNNRFRLEMELIRRKFVDYYVTDIKVQLEERNNEKFRIREEKYDEVNMLFSSQPKSGTEVEEEMSWHQSSAHKPKVLTTKKKSNVRF